MIQWFFDLALQGVSRAGLKQGMDDSRSSLCKHFFRLFDQAMEEGSSRGLIPTLHLMHSQSRTRILSF